ncbi:MAG: hypothetical protein IH621_02180, partial [Krumholzibacteria bacterium]|nr:hypothetical protein [Candidatus Krumholzibacteria bacterium]
MDSDRFWQEEMRRFPYGGKGAALWLVRSSGPLTDAPGTAAPLGMLYAWASGAAARRGLAAQPPLGAMLKAMTEEREQLLPRDDDAALWLEPLCVGGRVRACLAVWFDAAEAWRETIFLWAQDLAARLGAVIDQLEPVLPPEVRAAAAP